MRDLKPRKFDQVDELPGFIIKKDASQKCDQAFKTPSFFQQCRVLQIVLYTGFKICGSLPKYKIYATVKFKQR